MNVHVPTAPAEPESSTLPLADARRAVAEKHGRIPTGPREGGAKVYVAGELYPDIRDAAETIMYLRNDAPGYLQPELAVLEARCTSILRSIAN